MISTFKQETAPLSDYEREILLPIMVKCLNNKKGKENIVANSFMVSKLTEFGYQVTGVRVRKLINHIRINKLIQDGCLLATGRGYYISNDPVEIKQYIQSLDEREGAIHAMRLAIEEQLEDTINRNQQTSTEKITNNPMTV